MLNENILWMGVRTATNTVVFVVNTYENVDYFYGWLSSPAEFGDNVTDFIIEGVVLDFPEDINPDTFTRNWMGKRFIAETEEHLFATTVDSVVVNFKTNTATVFFQVDEGVDTNIGKTKD